GVGVSVVNFLSEWLRIEIWRDGSTYEQEYIRGIAAARLQPTGKTKRRGTKVSFKPDPEIFEVTEFNFDTLSQRLREKAFLNSGVRISINDERTEKSHEFFYKGGIAEFVKHLNKNKSVLHNHPIHLDREATATEPLAIEVAIQYNDGYNEIVHSFANNINTVDGGTHMTGFRAALTRTINNYAKSSGLFMKGWSRSSASNSRSPSLRDKRRASSTRMLRARSKPSSTRTSACTSKRILRLHARSSQRPSMRRARGRRPARLAISHAGKGRSTLRRFRASWRT